MSKTNPRWEILSGSLPLPVANGADVVRRWDLWQKNKGKRGYHLIPTEEMHKVEPGRNANVLDYLAVALCGKKNKI